MKCREVQIEPLIPIYRDLFINRSDKLALQHLTWYEPLSMSNDELKLALYAHLEHRATYGAYSYNLDGMCRWMCFDIDLVKPLREAFVEHREVLFHAAQSVKAYLIDSLGVNREAISVEFSGGKGFHVWIFLAEPVHVYRVQSFWRSFMANLPSMPEQVSSMLERFPHQDTDPAEGLCSNLVKMPYCWHLKARGMSYFVDDSDSAVDPLEALTSIQKWSLPECYSLERPLLEPKKPKQRKTCRIEVIAPEGEPDLTDDVKRAFNRCALLSKFKDEPEGLDYHEWKNAGIILTKLGRQDWFKWLSYQDYGRWDDQHQYLIDNVMSDAIEHMPTCSERNSSACSGCPFKSPLEAATQRVSDRYEPVWIGHRPEPRYIEMDDLRRKRMEVLGGILDSGRAGIYLDTTPVGSGKSHGTIQVLKDKGKRALWCAPNNHAQADEVAGKFGDAAICIYGRDYMVDQGFECPHNDKLKQSARMGVSLEGAYCYGSCPKRGACEYLNQFKEAQNSQFVILMHQHLMLRRSKMEELLQDRDCIVIDEAFLPVFRSEVTFTRTDLVELRSVLVQLGERMIIRRWINPLLELEAGSMVLPRMCVDHDTMRRVNQHFAATGKRSIMGDLVRAMGKATVRIKEIAGALFYWFIHTIELPTDLPVIVLDASGQLEDYRLALGDDYRIEQLDLLGGAQLRKHPHVTQVVTGSYPNSTVLENIEGESCIVSDPKPSKTGEAIIQFIRERIAPEETTGIIATKQFLPCLQKALVDIPRVVYGHYKKLRGVNEFEHVDTLFVVGYQGVNYMEISKQARVWFDQDWDDAAMVKSLEHERHWRDLSYYKDGLGFRVKQLYPSNPYMRAFLRDVYAEVDQAVGRIRPYSPLSKGRVFIMTNIPVSLPVDEVEFLGSVGESKTLNKVIAAATKLLHEHGQFTFKILMAESEVPERTLRGYIKPMCEIMNLVKFGGKEHIFAAHGTELKIAKAA